MSNSTTTGVRGRHVNVGDKLPTLQLDVTASRIIATAFASRDFMAIHHDAAHAARQGLPNIILNVIATSGFLERLVGQWAGPEATLKNVKFRVGVPVMPGDRVRFDAQVSAKNVCGEDCQIELAVVASNAAGNHAWGSMTVAVPN